MLNRDVESLCKIMNNLSSSQPNLENPKIYIDNILHLTFFLRPFALFPHHDNLVTVKNTNFAKTNNSSDDKKPFFEKLEKFCLCPTLG